MIEQVFRVPLHADHRIPDMLDCFYHAVWRAGRDRKVLADDIDGLMMNTIHLDTCAPFGFVQPRAVFDDYGVRHGRPLGDQVRQSRASREMLYEGSSTGDVKNLTSATNAQNR